VCHEAVEYNTVTVEFMFEKTVTRISYTHTSGSSVVIRIYVTF